jgi:hypothetical protein
MPCRPGRGHGGGDLISMNEAMVVAIAASVSTVIAVVSGVEARTSKARFSSRRARRDRGPTQLSVV